MSRLLVLLSLACSTATTEDTSVETDAQSVAPWPSFAEYSEDEQTVAQVDPARYLGLWYEFATTPSQQQQYCAGTTAEYSLIDTETIGVLNQCFVGSLDGMLNQIEGTARPIDDTYARLLVDLGVGFELPYNVIELDGSEGDDPYAFAAVFSLSGQIWILSRTPDLDPEVQEELWLRLEDRGLDTSDLIETEHAEIER